jgi:hypothetical protein
LVRVEGQTLALDPAGVEVDVATFAPGPSAHPLPFEFGSDAQVTPRLLSLAAATENNEGDTHHQANTNDYDVAVAVGVPDDQVTADCDHAVVALQLRQYVRLGVIGIEDYHRPPARSLVPDAVDHRRINGSGGKGI